MLSRHFGNKRTAAKRFCPTLDALEDRALLSVVLTTEDTTPGSLRAAIVAANATPGPDAITFALKPADPGHLYYQNDGVAGQVSLDHIAVTTAANDADIVDIDPDWVHSWWSIRPSTPLPAIKESVTIDGFTQPGAMENSLPLGSNAVLRIELDGEDAGLANGLLFRQWRRQHGERTGHQPLWRQRHLAGSQRQQQRDPGEYHRPGRQRDRGCGQRPCRVPHGQRRGPDRRHRSQGATSFRRISTASS